MSIENKLSKLRFIIDCGWSLISRITVGLCRVAYLMFYLVPNILSDQFAYSTVRILKDSRESKFGSVIMLTVNTISINQPLFHTSVQMLGVCISAIKCVTN